MEQDHEFPSGLHYTIHERLFGCIQHLWKNVGFLLATTAHRKGQHKLDTSE